MSAVTANYILNTFGLGVHSIDQLVSLFDQHVESCETKDEITGIQKLINSRISMAEENGGELIAYAVRLVHSITCSMRFSMLEGNVVRLLEFAKAVVLYCPDFEAKNTGNHVAI